MSHHLNFDDLISEAKERNTVITFIDSATDECFRVLPNGRVEHPEWITTASICAIRQQISKTTRTAP